MKRKSLSTMLACILAAGVFTGCASTEKKSTEAAIAEEGNLEAELEIQEPVKVVLNEVAHSISDSADIGFMGSEASIYTYNEGANDYVVNFAQLTQRAGNFLVAKEPMPEFTWNDLKGKMVLGGRKGGMPVLNYCRIFWKNIYDLEKISNIYGDYMKIIIL